MVWLDCGADQELECVVLGFVGTALLLLPRRLPRPTTRARLVQGTLFAELLVEAGAYMQAFPCRAQSRDTPILVHLTDGVHVS